MKKLHTLLAAVALATAAFAPITASAQVWGDTMLEGNTDGIESDSSGGYATGESDTTDCEDIYDGSR